MNKKEDMSLCSFLLIAAALIVGVAVMAGYEGMAS
jgi:hypothetical protein